MITRHPDTGELALTPVAEARYATLKDQDIVVGTPEYRELAFFGGFAGSFLFSLTEEDTSGPFGVAYGSDRFLDVMRERRNEVMYRISVLLDEWGPVARDIVMDRAYTSITEEMVAIETVGIKFQAIDQDL